MSVFIYFECFHIENPPMTKIHFVECFKIKSKVVDKESNNEDGSTVSNVLVYQKGSLSFAAGIINAV